MAEKIILIFLWAAMLITPALAIIVIGFLDKSTRDLALLFVRARLLFKHTHFIFYIWNEEQEYERRLLS